MTRTDQMGVEGGSRLASMLGFQLTLAISASSARQDPRQEHSRAARRRGKGRRPRQLDDGPHQALHQPGVTRCERRKAEGEALKSGGDDVAQKEIQHLQFSVVLHSLLETRDGVDFAIADAIRIRSGREVRDRGRVYTTERGRQLRSSHLRTAGEEGGQHHGGRPRTGRKREGCRNAEDALYRVRIARLAQQRADLCEALCVVLVEPLELAQLEERRVDEVGRDRALRARILSSPRKPREKRRGDAPW